jgi:acyl-coenzyme A synthetase/AMP-(fatty) acid ligase/acyl carrier protein
LDISSLKLLVLGSDLLHLADYKLLLQRFGSGMRIINCYGVTEATIDSSCYEASEEDLPDTGYTPIGKPLNNVKMYVVNADLQLQAVGAIGELCIGGTGVARGYLNRPELSAERFVDNPFSPGERLYRTGDMARWLPDGNIDFLGRIDFQVKIRGYRIELGEIESGLLLHPSIEHAIVAVKEDSSGESFLCAYLVCSESTRPGDVREYLSQFMPEYMIPARYIFMDRLPLSQNGKVDRKALPEPEASAAASYEEPEHPVEVKLAEIWSQVLGAKRVGREDHFFELGGHSLKAMTLVSRIAKELQTNLPLREVFRFPTLRAMSDRIRASKRAEVYASISPAPNA